MQLAFEDSTEKRRPRVLHPENSMMTETMPEHLSSTIYTCYATGIFLLFVIGITLQALNLYSLLRRENRQKELTPYLLSISFANFVFLLSSYPSTFLSALNYRWIFDHSFCIVEGFLAGTSAISMICLLSVMVVKTSNAITKVSHVNRSSPRYRSYKKDLIFVWSFSVGVMLPPLLGLTTMRLEGGGTNCAPNWKPTNTPDAAYALVLTIFAFVLPVMISIVYLVKIYRSLFKHRQMCKQRIYRRKERHVIDYGNISKLVGASIFIFVLLWTPYSIGVLVSVLGRNDQILDGDISLFPTLFAKSSAVFSPVVYCTFNVRFRRILVNVITCKLRKGSSRVQPLTKTTLETTTDRTQCDTYPEKLEVKHLNNINVKRKFKLEDIKEEEELCSSVSISRYSERRGALKNSWI